MDTEARISSLESSRRRYRIGVIALLVGLAAGAARDAMSVSTLTADRIVLTSAGGEGVTEITPGRVTITRAGQRVVIGYDARERGVLVTVADDRNNNLSLLPTSLGFLREAQPLAIFTPDTLSLGTATTQPRIKLSTDSNGHSPDPYLFLARADGSYRLVSTSGVIEATPATKPAK